MSESPVAANVPQPGNVLLHLATQLPFDQELLVEQIGNPRQIVVAQLAGFALQVQAQLTADLDRRCPADAVQVTQGNVRRLVGRNVDAADTGHSPLLCTPLAHGPPVRTPC